MSEDNNGKPNANLSFQPGAGQPPANVQDPPDAGQEDQPKFITIEEAQRLAKEVAQEVGEQTFRRTQALVDKADNRIGKQVDAAVNIIQDNIANARLAGVTVSPEQEKNMLEQATNEAILQAGQSDGEPSSPGADTLDPITQQAMSIATAAGIDPNEDYPEYQEMLKNDGTAEEFLQSVFVAAQAVKSRLASEGSQEPQTTRLPTGSLTTGRQTSPNFLEMDNDSLWAEARKSINK